LETATTPNRSRLAVAAPAAVAAMLVLIATRHDPLLSPDSITYLSVADHIRSGRGLTDFTTKPMTVFGPLYPLLLAIGGRSLLWARVIGACSIAAGTAVMGIILRRRTHPAVAVAGALAFAASIGMVRMASVVWSEAPYAVIALAMLAVLSGVPLTARVAALGGVLAGLGFLTRYAGVGLLVTGAVMVVTATWNRDHPAVVIRRLGIFLGCGIGVGSIWAIRNIVETGQPLGPRFSGGAAEPFTATVRLALAGIGTIVVGDGWSRDGQVRFGTIILSAIAVCVAMMIYRRRLTVLDVGMVAMALTSFIVPIAARRITANDIELRVMSPILVPVVYFAAIAVDRLRSHRSAVVVATAAFGWWAYQGVTFAATFPDLAPSSSGYRPQFSAELYDKVSALPADAIVITNSPQRTWWFTDREPVLLGYTRPRPGNSYYPLSADRTVELACSGNAYLAWFDSLQNAGDGPKERRPDLAKVVNLRTEAKVDRGTLYRLAVIDATRCRSDIAVPTEQG
jgi:hypothetical protein